MIVTKTVTKVQRILSELSEGRWLSTDQAARKLNVPLNHASRTLWRMQKNNMVQVRRRKPPSNELEWSLMPIFTYRCESCAARFDLLQKHHKDPAPDCCPSCSAAGALVRELSASSFHLKGDGWAKDNYTKPPTTNGRARK